MSLAARADLPYRVPDFTADAEVQSRYDAAAKAHIHAAINAATYAVGVEYERQRRELETAAQLAENERRIAEVKANTARTRYAALVPKQRTASGIVRPPTLFFDVLITMGAADKYYREAVKAAHEQKAATLKSRAATAELERVTNARHGAIVKCELELRRHFKSPAGRAELDAQADLHELAAQCAAIEAERADFHDRFAAGDVSDEEFRDRTMAQEGYRFLDGEVPGISALRDRELRFGSLRYGLFRDREDRLWLLDATEDLRPLWLIRFDISRTDERYFVTRTQVVRELPDSGPKARHAGTDPRAYLGVDDALLRALRDFIAREMHR